MNVNLNDPLLLVVNEEVEFPFRVGIDGLNAYELWLTIPGNENKTFQEWLDYLQQPANDAANEIGELEEQVRLAELDRIDQEIIRGDNENIRKQNELDRGLAEGDREIVKQEMIDERLVSEELNENPPILIDVSGRQLWHYWDLTSHSYVSTGLPGAFNFVPSNLESYQKYDVVQVNGTSYISLDDNNTSTIEEGVNWKVVAKKGVSTYEIYKAYGGTLEETAFNTLIGNIDNITTNAIEATTDANEAADLANEKANLADTKAGLANDAASLANNAADLANDKASLANTKATLAQEAADLANEVATHPPVITEGTWHYWDALTNLYVDTNISATPYENYLQNTTDNPPLTEAQWSVWSKEQGDYAKDQGDYAKNIGDTYDAAKVDKTSIVNTLTETESGKVLDARQGKVLNDGVYNIEEVAAQSLVDLKERIDALEELIKQGILNNIIIKTLSVEDFQLNGASLILTGADAPAVTPDFIGQFYIKTTATTACYQSTGTSAVGDWKQI